MEINQKISEPILVEDLGMLFPKDGSKSKTKYGLYLCSCGNVFKSMSCHIKSKKTKSCGCYNRKKTKERLTTHGLRYHPLYKVWRGIKDRCYNQQNKAFVNYGGRGIKICNEWKVFKCFYDDMISNYRAGLTIDRIDNDGNYEPLNCRWVSCSIQSRNCRVLRKSNTSGFKGVCFNKKTKKWNTRICVDGKSKFLGIFNFINDAALAYDAYIIENNLEHSRNFNE